MVVCGCLSVLPDWCMAAVLRVLHRARASDREQDIVVNN